MNEMVKKILEESLCVQQKAFEDNREKIAQAADLILKRLALGGKVLLFGNGGSAADSQHIAAELIGRFQKERRSIAAVALSTDTSILTALSNDYSFDIIFARQIEGLGSPSDVAIGLSTSGNSKNVIEGIKTAKAMGMATISLTGCRGGKIAALTDVSLIVASDTTARVQEAHIGMAHAICELVENAIASKQ